MNAVATPEHIDNEINANHFLLRMVKANDDETAWLELMNRPEVQAGLNLSPSPISIEECQTILASYSTDKQMLMGIYTQDTEQLAGFYVLDVDPKNRTASMAFAANTDVADNTIGHTCDAFLDFCFTQLNIDKVSGRVIHHNKKALFVLLNNPRFELESILKKDCLLEQEVRADVLVWSSFKYPTINQDATHITPQSPDKSQSINQQIQSLLSNIPTTNKKNKDKKSKKNKAKDNKENKPENKAKKNKKNTTT